MSGDVHFGVGVYTGVLLVVVGLLLGNPMWLIALVLTPMGAMLPDIDHNSTKLGRRRKVIVHSVVLVGIGGSVLFAMSAVRVSGQMIPLALVVVVCFACYSLSTSKWFKKHIKFYTKHRGIMHTLVVPIALLIISIYYAKSEVLKCSCFAVSVGYISHLFGDCMTPESCPLLFPISKKPVNILRGLTKKIGEKPAAVLECLMLLPIAVFVIF